MDSINEKKSVDSFPYEALSRLRNTASQKYEKKSDFSARSYDNRGRISDIAASLQSKLGFFQTRLLSSSFLSDAFSWQVKTATTSDPDRLLAKADSNSREKDFSVEIDSLATTRTAQSDRFASSDASLVETGTYSYSLSIGSDSYAIEVDVENKIGAPATNRSVLLDIERSINRLGVDVKAELHDKKIRDYNPYRENAYKDISYLTITSDASGDEIEFSLSDTSGDLIENMGLDKITSFGSKNYYSMNGTKGGSSSNEIILQEDELTAYLLNTTSHDENLQINVKKGKIELALELKQIINDYNELINWIDDNDSVISPNLKTDFFKGFSSSKFNNNSLKSQPDSRSFNPAADNIDFASAINLKSQDTFDDDLEDIGLTLKSDGTLDISDGFSTSVLSNLRRVYDTLAGTDGFFSKISEAIDTIHDKNENNYIFSFNSVLSYDSNGANRQSIYRSNSSSIISFFA